MKKHNKQAIILSWICIALIAGVIIYMLYCAFSGHNFLGSLYLVIVVPVIIWAVLFFAGKFNKDDDSDDESKN